MPTSKEFIDFVLERLECAENLSAKYAFSARKLFGEYCVYVRKFDESELNKKVLFLVCDEQVFVRKYEILADLVSQNPSFFELGFAYDGAKEGYILDVENAEILAKVVDLSYPFLHTPKKRKKKA